MQQRCKVNQKLFNWNQNIIDTHAFTGVLFSKLKLCLFCLFLFLGLDVSLNYFFVYSYRRYKIPFTSNAFSVPIYFLQESKKLSAERSAGILFEGFHYFTYGILWWDYHIQMNMILLYSHLYILPIRIISSDLLKFNFQITFYTGDQNLPQIARDPDNMILGLLYGMSCFM